MGTAVAGSDYLGVGKAILVGILAGLLFTCGMHPTYASDTERRDIRCFFSDEKIKTLEMRKALAGAWKGKAEGVLILYSLDGMEKPTVAMFYPLHQGHLWPFPTVYMFGEKFEQVYVDRTGDGVCKSITLEQ